MQKTFTPNEVNSNSYSKYIIMPNIIIIEIVITENKVLYVLPILKRKFVKNT